MSAESLTTRACSARRTADQVLFVGLRGGSAEAGRSLCVTGRLDEGPEPPDST